MADYLLCSYTLEKAMFHLSYLFSSFSLIGLILVLYFTTGKYAKKSIILNGLLILASAEVFNCLSKLINPLRLINEEWHMIVSQIQIVFALFSDLSTLLSSLIISLKIYASLTGVEISLFKGSRSVFRVRIFLIILPLISALAFMLINLFAYKGTAKKGEEECKSWAWIYSTLSLIIYGIVWVIIITIIIVSCKSISFLNRKNKQICNNEESEGSDTGGKEQNKTEISLTKETEKSVLSVKIQKTIHKLYFFPYVTCIIWILLSIDRIPDDIINTLNRDKQPTDKGYIFYAGFFLYLKYCTLVLHNVIVSSRGFIYCVTFSKCDTKLYSSIKSAFKCLFSCKKTHNTEALNPNTLNELPPHSPIEEEEE